jgi:hypothetical protein
MPLIVPIKKLPAEYSGILNRLFPVGHHPSHNITAEDIHDYIELKICPFGWALEPGYIPYKDPDPRIVLRAAHPKPAALQQKIVSMEMSNMTLV